MVLNLIPYQIDVWGLSDIGIVRQNNEDVWSELPKHQFYAIADGMGGHLAGEIAAKEAIKDLCALIDQTLEHSQPTLFQLKKIIYQSIKRMNLDVYKLSRTSPDYKGMGTTLCCLAFHSDGLVYAHVGDSRIYRLRKNKLVQLTKDHSLLRQLLEKGQLSEGEAPTFAYKNIITKAIGTEPSVEPAVRHTFVEPGDMFLMCTDGLTDLLTNKEITETLCEFSTPAEIAQELVLKANRLGGYDNITVVVAKTTPLHE